MITARTIALLAFTAAILLLVLMAGRALGRRSRRFDYPDGFDSGHAAGVAAERQRWEANGTTLDALAAWQDHREPEPDLDGGWQEPPPTDVLMAEAVRQGYAERVPSVAEVDELAAQWEAKHAGADSHVRTGASAPGWPGARGVVSHPSPAPSMRSLGPPFRNWDEPPVVADLTGPAAWHYPGEDDVATVAGVVVPPPERGRTGPEWLECQLAAQDSEAAAWMRGVEAEMASFRRGIGTRP